MKKHISDCTFTEFVAWCNQRACDGRWNFSDATLCTKIVDEVYVVKPLFGRKKAREKKWEELRKTYLNLDSEIEIQK